MNIVSRQRKTAQAKHARWVHVCKCGKECRGNGGWSSHKRACEVYKAAKAEGKQ